MPEAAPADAAAAGPAMQREAVFGTDSNDGDGNADDGWEEHVDAEGEEQEDDDEDEEEEDEDYVWSKPTTAVR